MKSLYYFKFCVTTFMLPKNEKKNLYPLNEALGTTQT